MPPTAPLVLTETATVHQARVSKWHQVAGTMTEEEPETPTAIAVGEMDMRRSNVRPRARVRCR